MPSCTYSFWHGVSLHPTSFLMIFILVSLIFYPGLTLTVARGEMPYVRTVYVVRTLHARTYAHAYCAGSCFLNFFLHLYMSDTRKSDTVKKNNNNN